MLFSSPDKNPSQSIRDAIARFDAERERIEAIIKLLRRALSQAGGEPSPGIEPYPLADGD